MTKIDLSKLDVMGDSLIYRGRIKDCRIHIVDDDGKRYPLLADLGGTSGAIIKQLLDFHRQHSGRR